MRGKSGLAERGRADLSPASNVSLGASKFPEALRWLRLLRRDSHRAAEKFAAFRAAPAKNFDHRPALDAMSGSFVARGPASAVFPRSTGPRRASCRLEADAPVVR